MNVVAKWFGGGGVVCLLVLLARGNAAAPVASSPEKVSSENRADPAPTDRKMVELAERLNAQVDASLRDIPMPAVGLKGEPDATSKPTDPRPLYLRRHGISAGTRIEWVPPPAEKPKALPVAEPTRPTVDLQPYLDAAEAGDARAMTLLGLIYHLGEGVPQDLLVAHDWYLKAAAKGDGDAITNLGALYWDGFAGRRNRKIAYVVLLNASRSGEGTDLTRARAQRTLDRLIGQLSRAEVEEALSYTWPYVRQVLRSQGTDFTITPDVLPTKGRPRIRDNSWWRDNERAEMAFTSPAPWDVIGE